VGAHHDQVEVVLHVEELPHRVAPAQLVRRVRAGEAAEHVVDAPHLLLARLLEAALQLGVHGVEVRAQPQEAERLLEARLHVHEVQRPAQSLREVAGDGQRLLCGAGEVGRVKDAHCPLRRRGPERPSARGAGGGRP